MADGSNEGMEVLREGIMSGTKHAQQNTWGNRYQRVVPTVRMEGSCVTYSTSMDSVTLDEFDEIILTLVVKFQFVPMWLVRQMYQSTGAVGSERIADSKVIALTNVGLVWREADVTGLYIRPTYALFDLFGFDGSRAFTNIPFNTLRHTICEEQLMFEIMAGISDVCNEPVMPRVSELGFQMGQLSGTNVIHEGEFRNPALMNNALYETVMDAEHSINEGIKRGLRVTKELEDFRYFNLVKKIGNTGEVKKDFKFHVPDLIVPVVRDNGKSMSIAVEMELSNKRINYIETMERYKDNNKFAAVYWYCGDPSVVEYLRQAYEAVGGTGSCRMELREFIVPSPGVEASML